MMWHVWLLRVGTRHGMAWAGRPFLMACSSCGPDNCTTQAACATTGCGAWVASGAVSCDVWRTGGDIQARWSSIMSNLESNTLMAEVQNTHPGHFNDPDMLQVGSHCDSWPDA